MRSTAFALMFGLAALIPAACSSTEKNAEPMSGGMGDEAQRHGAMSADRPGKFTPPVMQPAVPAKQPSPSSAPRAETQGQHASHPPPVGTGTRDATGPSEQVDQRETRITPLDQSNAPNDLETTRRIRQGVIQDDSLSFRAKNVTIVTNGDRVVLTGRVNTRAEAERIKDIARSVTPYRIEDQLEIRP
jgi:hypothetical protein